LSIVKRGQTIALSIGHALLSPLGSFRAAFRRIKPLEVAGGGKRLHLPDGDLC